MREYDGARQEDLGTRDVQVRAWDVYLYRGGYWAPKDSQAVYKWGYIDKAGTMVIEPQFDRAGSFSEGLAAVKIKE